MLSWFRPVCNTGRRTTTHSLHLGLLVRPQACNQLDQCLLMLPTGVILRHLSSQPLVGALRSSRMSACTVPTIETWTQAATACQLPYSQLSYLTQHALTLNARDSLSAYSLLLINIR